MGLAGVGEVENGDTALIPALNHNVTTRNGDERAVVGYASFSVTVCGTGILK